MHIYAADNFGGVREISGDAGMVDFIVDVNAPNYIFFKSPHPIETNREPFVINKIA